MKIMLDAGHSSSDPGAVSSGLVEATLTKKVVDVIKKQLSGYDVDVLETSRGTLSDRTSEANRAKADFFLSIHFNAGQGTGFESFVHNNASGTTKGIREALHKNIAGLFPKYGIKDRGMKYANFEVLRNTNMPAVLLEGLFIDHPADVQLLKDDKFIHVYGNEITYSLAVTFGLQTKKNCETCKELNRLIDENRRMKQEMKQLAGICSKYVAM